MEKPEHKLRFLAGEHLHGPQLRFDSRLDIESIPEEYIAFLSEDGEDELIIVFQTTGEVIERHDRVFDLATEECFLKEVVELDLIEFSDDEYIDDIVGCLAAEVENCR